ncbi:DUF3265 domain-containing protein [Vibrio vulnificus]|nr:DUF3265 domain-containing protein [Vibrio vulnificus]EIC2761644.1 DUF3265 domain-containing protein [Vibrio vulnificus]
MKPIFTNCSCAPNKALKRDSCRVAFLVCGGFGGENGLQKLGLGGIHPLTRRYATDLKNLPRLIWTYSMTNYKIRTALLMGEICE